jgi:hypothetical protein
VGKEVDGCAAVTEAGVLERRHLVDAGTDEQRGPQRYARASHHR